MTDFPNTKSDQPAFSGAGGSTFFIVNPFDRPCERLIAQARDGKLYYVHDSLRAVKSFHGMPMDRATPVEDFGVRLMVRRDKLHGKVIGETRATYTDGKPRRWQGAARFTVDMSNDQVSNSGRETTK